MVTGCMKLFINKCQRKKKKKKYKEGERKKDVLKTIKMIKTYIHKDKIFRGKKIGNTRH